MYLDQPATREALLKIISTITHHEALQDDLLQEGLIHLWMIESRRPDQTKSWYLQSCKFHLLHYLGAGRSVDSGKRRNGQLAETEFTTWIEEADQIDAEDAVFTAVCAEDLISLLSRRLSRQERAVLDCLADGLGAREIGRALGISHSMAIKHRRKIAALAKRLENAPARLPGRSRNGRTDLLHTNSRRQSRSSEPNGFTRPSTAPGLPAPTLPLNPGRCQSGNSERNQGGTARRDGVPTINSVPDSELLPDRILDIRPQPSLMADYD